MKSWDDLQWWKKEGPNEYPWPQYMVGKIGDNCSPPRGLWYNALSQTPLHDVRAVILGQDPYPTPGHATGLAFSVPKELRPFPPTLSNIFRELRSDLLIRMPSSGDLTPWAKQGVLLLNTCLTCVPGKPGSHAGLGWEDFTTEVLSSVKKVNPKAVFVLWGSKAQRLALPFSFTNVAVSAHPSPLSAHRGFFGSRPFSTTNALLVKSGQQPIDWRLP